VTITTADHHAPSRRAICGRDRLDHLTKLQRVHPSTTQVRGQEEAKNAGVDESIDHRASEPTLAFSLIGMLGNQGHEITRSTKGCMDH
jgi:hypothetical protein